MNPYPFTGIEEITMDYELLAVILGALLPVYPALFGIYQKIGTYDAVCEYFRAHLKDHPPYSEIHHGTGDHHYH
jgi:hypothetical protein